MSMCDVIRRGALRREEDAVNGSSLQGSRRGRTKRRWLDKPIVRDDVKKEDTVGGGSVGPRSSHMEAYI